MAWWQEPPFGGRLDDLGAAVSTANATWWLVVATSAAAIATFAAVVTALFGPKWLADREQRRKHAAALKLAELVCDALGTSPLAYSRDDADARVSWRANLQSLINRMDLMPSDYIADAVALAAFIWMADLAREAHNLESRFDADPSLDNAEVRLRKFPEFRRAAEQRLQDMRQRLPVNRAFSSRVD